MYLIHKSVEGEKHIRSIFIESQEGWKLTIAGCDIYTPEQVRQKASQVGEFGGPPLKGIGLSGPIER
jgi:hypothetical protein